MSSMLRASRVIALGLLGLGACANGVVDELTYEGDPNAAGTTSSGGSSGSGGSLGKGGTTGLGGTLGNGGSLSPTGGSAGTSPFGGAAGVTSGGGAGMAGSGGGSGAFGVGGSSGAFGTGGSAGKGAGGSGGTGANCTGLPSYPTMASAVNFAVDDEIQHKGIRYRVVIEAGIQWANSECAPDIAANWCDDVPESGQWWEVVGPC